MFKNGSIPLGEVSQPTSSQLETRICKWPQKIKLDGLAWSLKQKHGCFMIDFNTKTVKKKSKIADRWWGKKLSEKGSEKNDILY